jgi:polysaccharide biosynthesis protein PslG
MYINNKNNLSNKFFTALIVFFVMALGGYYISQSKAATTFQPIQTGINYQAGWSNGLHTLADNEAIVDNAVAVGMKWVRIDIGWSTIEEAGDIYGGASDPTATYPSSASNHWYIKKIDHAVNYARSRGLKVLGIWWTTPNWNQDGGPKNNYSIRPAGYPTYPEYAEAAEWAAKYWAGRVDHWEVWNEADPDQAFWVKPDGSKHTLAESYYYAELLKSSYNSFKRGNPNAKVLVSGASSVDVNWYSSLYAAGIKGYYDILAVHPYEGLANNDPLNTTGTQKWHYLYIPTLRQVMVDNGESDKPIWITEFGYSTHSNEDLTGDGIVKSWQLGVTEQQQGDYIVKAIDHAKKNWPYVEVFIAYADKDRASASGDAETVRHQLSFGLMRTDNTPKPGMQILSQYLGQTTAIKGDINLDNKVDVFDLSILLSKWNTNDTISDINKDAIVNVFDLSILLTNWTG